MRRTTAFGLLLATLLLAACDASPQDADGRSVDGRGASSSGDAGGNGSDGDDGADGGGEPITLAFAGDVHFAGALASLPRRGDATLGPLSKVLRRADLAMVNLETAVTTRQQPARKELEDPGNRYWFRAGPGALDVLDRSGVDVASVANNHGADYGAAGLRDTLRAAADGPVAVVGAGTSAEQAFAPYRTSIRGTDVAVLAADASPRESADPTWAIGSGTGPGLAAARGAQTSRLVAAVREAAASDDVVVVYLHWGEEGSGCPNGAQESLAAALTAAGADVVVGSHAHLLQGAGVLDADTGAYVSYGLGNFFWYHGNTAETGVLTLTLQGGEVVDDAWTPGRIRAAGGNPQAVSGRAGDVAVADWRGLSACTDLAPGPSVVAADAADDLPAFTSMIGRIGPAVRTRMTAHRPGRCPVALGDLRHLTVSYVDPEGRADRGELVVAADVADDVVSVFGALYAARFPIRRMRLVDVYGGDDDRSMAADNTSAYNCRRVAGSSAWSDHAYGRAIDINPVQNPYVLRTGPGAGGLTVLPPAGAPYVDVPRGPAASPDPGVIHAGDVVTRAFARIGWRWGATFTDPDFQHFAAP